MFAYRGTCTNTKGDALPGWYVECVNNTDLATPITIYADKNSTPIATVSGVANRAKVDDSGNFYFYVPEGQYGLRYYDNAGVWRRTESDFSLYGMDTATAAATAASAASASYAAAAAASAASLTNYGGPLVSGYWARLPSIYALRLGGTGTVTIDTKTIDGTITSAAATYTVTGTTQIQNPYFGAAAAYIRATLTSTATVEVF